MVVQLVMGLGNPGPKYAATRHNIGFRCVEATAQHLGLSFQADTAEYRLAVGEGPGGPVTLMLPLTYMNRSGRAVLAWSRRVGCSVVTPPPPAEDEEPLPAPDVVPVVVCDDIQLPLGSVRIRSRGRDGGQNGLASVLEAVDSLAVPRMRLGVGPVAGAVDPALWADYVLAPFDPDDEERVADLVVRSTAALLDLLEMGPEAAGSRHNRRIRPEPDLPGAV